MCMYVCMCVCMYVCIYVWMDVCGIVDGNVLLFNRKYI